jgi:hypothetical protein
VISVFPWCALHWTLDAVLNLKLVYVLVEKSASQRRQTSASSTTPAPSARSRSATTMASRRTDAVYLAGLVATHQPSEVDSSDVPATSSTRSAKTLRL